MGFNSAQLGDGNITNIVIKSRYALLDLKCGKLEIKLRSFLKQLVKIVLQEINQTKGSDYQLSDVYFEFDREVMTNASDNATIAKTEAETQQIKITILLNAASVLDQETVLKAICDLLELDFDEVKSKLPSKEEIDLNKASEALLAKPIEEGAGGGDVDE